MKIKLPNHRVWVFHSFISAHAFFISILSHSPLPLIDKRYICWPSLRWPFFRFQAKADFSCFLRLFWITSKYKIWYNNNSTINIKTNYNSYLIWRIWVFSQQPPANCAIPQLILIWCFAQKTTVHATSVENSFTKKIRNAPSALNSSALNSPNSLMVYLSLQNQKLVKRTVCSHNPAKTSTSVYSRRNLKESLLGEPFFWLCFLELPYSSL